MIKGRKIKNSGEEMMIKPFMTYENIDLQNDLVIEENINDYKEIEKNTMKIDSNVTDNIDICLNVMIDKEVIVNLGVVIQKGEELCLDGFFRLEIIPKSSDVEKFNFEGKLAFVKNERKVYAVALIISIIILPCNNQHDLGIKEYIIY
ncbi:unnamed protein product [Rhizophagus irregularis]|nr:unnamed protein product [Rhizophagus irregularis]